MTNKRTIAPWRNGAGSNGLSADIRGQGGAWHIWRNTQGRIICNGPSEVTRLIDCADIDGAVNAIFPFAQDVARALNEIKQRYETLESLQADIATRKD